MAFELNKQQHHAVKEATKWFKKLPKQTFEISGPPGSGKSTIVSELVSATGLQSEEVLYVAFIGKAAQSLAMKGHNAKTIHSTIYNMEEIPKLNDYGDIITINGKVVTRRSFVKKESIGENIKLIVLDEGGSVDTSLGSDLLSYGIPVLVLGDIDQLPPVFGKSPFLQNPDVILTDIMRQAEDSEIIWMFMQAKEGKRIPYGRYGNSYVVHPDDVNNQMLKAVDIIITNKNKTRDSVNAYFRENILKVDAKSPITIGDKLVCRKNNWQEKISVSGIDINLINGLIGYVDDINLSSLTKSVVDISFRPDFSEFDMFNNIALDLDYLLTPCAEEYKGFGYSNRFQYGYAISAHLSQGSEYNGVMYYKESNSTNSYQRKLDYVGLSRARGFNILVQE